MELQPFNSINYCSPLLAMGYSLSYNLYLEKNIFDGFELYSGLDGLYSMFANEILLLVFGYIFSR